MKSATFLVSALLLLIVSPGPTDARQTEIIWYLQGDGERLAQHVEEHAAGIDVVAPQAYAIDREGNLSGSVSQALLDVARRNGLMVMPLFLNPGFDQEIVHDLLNSREARARAVDQLVSAAREHDYWGWQFDLENIHVSDRDALTTFYREAANALHADGRIISIAVVPTNGGPGGTAFGEYMQDNWRNSFDVKALADAGDFVSWMTYAQHGGPTAPGPIAGVTWIREMMSYVLAEGVPAEQISMGIPTYSGWWQPTYSESRGARVAGHEIPFSKASELLDAYGTETTWLPSEGTSYAFWQNEGVFEWLFLEDARAMAHKLQVFRGYPALRGISIWVLGAEDPAVWPLLKGRN